MVMPPLPDAVRARALAAATDAANFPAGSPERLQHLMVLGTILDVLSDLNYPADVIADLSREADAILHTTLLTPPAD